MTPCSMCNLSCCSGYLRQFLHNLRSIRLVCQVFPLCRVFTCSMSGVAYFIYAQISNIAIYMSANIYTVQGIGNDFYWIIKTG